MRFGGEVHNGVRLLFGDQRIDQFRIADIAVHETVARTFVHGARFSRLPA